MFIGGKLADHFGLQKVLAAGFIWMLVSLAGLCFSASLSLSILLLLMLSMAESLCYSPLVVLSQDLLPESTGFASGISLGLSVSAGAILCPFLGILADQMGILVIFPILLLVSAVGLLSLLASYRMMKKDQGKSGETAGVSE